MSSMSPDMFVGEHDKNIEAIRKARNIIAGKSEDGTKQYLGQCIPDETSRLDDVISELDSRITDTQRDIKGLEKNSDEKAKYEKDLEELLFEKKRASKRRERLHQPRWTPPIED